MIEMMMRLKGRPTELKIGLANVRFGSKADIHRALMSHALCSRSVAKAKAEAVMASRAEARKNGRGLP